MTLQVLTLVSTVICLLGQSSIACGENAERIQEVKERISQVIAPQSYQPETRATESFRFFNDATSKHFAKSLPGFDYDLGEIYSGLIPINKNDPSRSMFFIFQPTINEPVDEITIWFNGGPGCSSLEGRFIWPVGGFSAIENPYSWVNLANMLWVEYPVGVGFSEGEVTATTQQETAQDFLGFFKNFQKTFGISKFNTYVTGESYAGRFVPYVSAAMIDAKDDTYYNLKGAMIYDPIIGEYYWQHCAVPIVPFVEDHANFYNFNETFMAHLKTAHEYCGYANYTSHFLTYPPPGNQPALYAGANNVSLPFLNTRTNSMSWDGDINCDLFEIVSKEAYRTNPCFNVMMISQMCPLPYDPLGVPTELPFTWPNSGGIYFNRTDVKESLHAPMNRTWGGTCGYRPFKGHGGPYGVGDTSLDSIQHVLPRVIEATNRVLIANGDYDQEILTWGTMLAIQNMTWNGKLGFQNKPSTPIDIKLPDLQYAQLFLDTYLKYENDGFDGPGGQGIMGIQHYERGLL
ncbi:serine-type carboxypeptidase F [Trichoderma evansii]